MKIILKIVIAFLLLMSIAYGSILLFYNSTIKYSEEIEIEKSIETLDKIFGNIYNMQKYMDGITNIELINGTNNNKDAEYKFTWKMGKEEVEIIGKLKIHNLPHNLTIIYKIPGVTNTVTQKHRKIDNNKTLVINEQTFKLNSIMKIIAFFKPQVFDIDVFRKQSKAYLNAFKKFAEEESQK